MIKCDPILYRAVCDCCSKVSNIVGTSAGKAKGDVLNLPHSPVGRPWVEIDGKLYCDGCGIRLLGTEGYFSEVRALVTAT